MTHGAKSVKPKDNLTVLGEDRKGSALHSPLQLADHGYFGFWLPSVVRIFT